MLLSVQCCFTSTEALGTIKDGEPRAATWTLTQLLSSGALVCIYFSGDDVVVWVPVLIRLVVLVISPFMSAVLEMLLFFLMPGQVQGMCAAFPAFIQFLLRSHEVRVAPV